MAADISRLRRRRAGGEHDREDHQREDRAHIDEDLDECQKLGSQRQKESRHPHQDEAQAERRSKEIRAARRTASS